MSQAILNKIAAKDQGMANAVKAASGGNPRAVIDKRGAAQIFAEMKDGQAITGDEAEALVLILENFTLSEEAEEWLKKMIMTKAGREHIIRGAGKVLKTDKELESFNRALDRAGQVNFFSHGTWLTYRPVHYQVIKELVKRGDIEAVQIDDRDLYSTLFSMGAFYMSEENRLYLPDNKGANSIRLAATIVHEVTHAIADWFNVTSITKHLEADAYIAGAVTVRAAGVTLTGLDPVDPMRVALEVAPIVLKNQATESNRAWERAYFEVVTAVWKNPLYSHKKGLKVQDLEEEDGPDEKDIFLRLQRTLTRAG